MSKNVSMVLFSVMICKSLKREGLQGPKIIRLGTSAVSLFLSNLSCLPKVCIQAVCGV